MAQVFIDIKGQSNLAEVANSVKAAVDIITQSLSKLPTDALKIDTSGIKSLSESVAELNKSLEDTASKLEGLGNKKPGSKGKDDEGKGSDKGKDSENKKDNPKNGKLFDFKLNTSNIKQATGLFSSRIGGLVSSLKPAAGPLLALTAAIAAMDLVSKSAKRSIEELQAMYANALTATALGLKESDIAKYEYLMKKLGGTLEDGAKYASGVANLYAKARQGNADAQQLIAEVGNTANIRIDWLKESVSDFSEKFTLAVASINKQDIDTGKFTRITSAIGDTAKVLANKDVSNINNVKSILAEAQASGYTARSIKGAGKVFREGIENIGLTIRQASSDFFSSENGKKAIDSISQMMDSFAGLIKYMVDTQVNSAELAKTFDNISSIVTTLVDAAKVLLWIFDPIISFISDLAKSLIFLARVILDFVKLIGANLDDMLAMLHGDFSFKSTKAAATDLDKTLKSEPSLSSPISRAIASPAQEVYNKIKVNEVKSSENNEVNKKENGVINNFKIFIDPGKGSNAKVRIEPGSDTLGELNIEQIVYNGAS